MDKGKMFTAEVAEYGKDMVNFVMATGLANAALEKIAPAVPPATLQLLGDSLVTIAAMLAEAKGWERGRLGDCEHAILLAAGSALPPKIVLPSSRH